MYFSGDYNRPEYVPFDSVSLESITADSWYREAPPPVCPMTYMLPYMASEDLDSDDDSDMMRSPINIRNLLQQFEQNHPQIFAQFENFKAPRFFIRRIFRQITAFVVKSIDMVKPIPQAAGQYVQSIYDKLVKERPYLVNVFTFFGIPYNIIKQSILSLIGFVVGMVHMTGIGTPAPPPGGTPIDRIIKISETGGVLRELAGAGIPEAEGRLLVESAAKYVIDNPLPQGSIQQMAPVLTEKIIRDTGIYRSMTAKGILPARARSIIRDIVITTLRETQ